MPSKKVKKKDTKAETRVKLIKITSIVLALIIAVLAAYIRLQPSLKNGFELQGDDSWQVYWVSKYLVENGLAAWFRLDRNNPDTHIFWYPWGQDFKYIDYPLIHMINAFTYPLASNFGLSVKDWVSIVPAIFGGLMVISGFLLVRRIGGEIPALLTSLFLAFAPGNLERTIGSFAEKQGIVLTFIFLSLYFLHRSLSRRSFVDSIIAGVLTGLIGWTWGGYQAIYTVLSLGLVLSPLIHRYSFKEGLNALIVTALASLISVANTTITLEELIKGSVGVLFLSGALVFLTSLINEGKIRLFGLTPENLRKVYLSLIIALFVVGLGLLISGNLTIGGRAYYMLLGEPQNPLVASIAEHQPQSLGEVVKKIGVIFILGILYIPVGIYYSRKEFFHLILVISTIMSYFVIFNASYLTQVSSSLISLAGGLAIYPVYRLAFETSRRPSKEYYAALLAIVILLTLAFIPTLKLGFTYASQAIPSPKTGMIGISQYNNAWYYALDYIRDELPPGSVIISWWDYGYLITSYTGKATVADGATSNGTQIYLLAKALTAEDENESLSIFFDYFKAPRDKTYILVFDVFQSIRGEEEDTWKTGPFLNPYTGIVGMGDIPKSVWMLRIAERLNLTELKPYFTIRRVQFLGGQQTLTVSPDWSNENVTKTLIYKLFINGVLSLGEIAEGPVDISGKHEFKDILDIYLGTDVPISVWPLENIRPYKAFVDSIYDTPTNKIYVAVFLFKVG